MTPPWARRPPAEPSSKLRIGIPCRVISLMKSFVIGLVLGLAFILLVHSVPPMPALQIIALFLALTACVYAGALLAQQAPFPIAVLELAVTAIVFALAV